MTLYKDWENWTNHIAEQQVTNYIKQSQVMYSTLNVSNNKLVELLSDDITEYSTLHAILIFLNSVKLITNYTELNNKLIKYANHIDNDKAIYNIILSYVRSNNVKEDTGMLLLKILSKFSLNCDHSNSSKLLRKQTNLEKYIEDNFTNNKSNVILLNEDELNGVNPEIIKTFERDINEKKYIIHLSDTIYKIFMTSIKESKTRKKIELFYSMKCYDLIKEISSLIITRNEIAILNIPNKKTTNNAFSDLQNSNSLLNNFEEIMRFIANCMDESNKLFSDNIEILKNLKRCNEARTVNSSDFEFGTWDIDYYINIYKNTLGVNNLVGYFQIEHIIRSTLSVFESLFKIKFTKKNITSRLVNTDVYSVFQNGQIIGTLYLDLYNNHNKSNDYDVECYIIESPCMYFKKGQRILPSSVITASFNQNTFSYDDVSSLFQKFGYCLHNMFGYNKYYLFSGINTSKDYMDLSSLLLEYVCWDSKVIKLMSNKQPEITQEVILKLKACKNFISSIDFHRQLASAVYDQFIYTNDFITKCQKILDNCDNSSNNNTIQAITSHFIQFNEYIHNKLYTNASKRKPIVNINEGTIMPYKLINNYDNAAQLYSYLYPQIVSADLLYIILKKKSNYEDLVQNIIMKLYNNEEFDKNKLIEELLHGKLVYRRYFDIIANSNLNNSSSNNDDKNKMVKIKKSKKIKSNSNGNHNTDAMESSDMYQTETTETLKKYANIFSKN